MLTAAHKEEEVIASWFCFAAGHQAVQKSVGGSDPMGEFSSSGGLCGEITSISVWCLGTVWRGSNLDYRQTWTWLQLIKLSRF